MTFYESLGYMVSAAAGMGLVILVLLVMLALIAYLGRKAWTNVSRIYHINVIAFWLYKMEKEGAFVFRKAGQPGYDQHAVDDLVYEVNSRRFEDAK